MLIQGPHRELTLFTDSEGIFESNDVPPGRYTFEVVSKTKSPNPVSARYTYDLQRGQIAEVRLTASR